jgi:hypothetical protein
MNRQNYQLILAERSQLRQMLERIPEDDVIDRISIQARLRDADALVAESAAFGREPARVRLTFRGQPVVGSYGIFADFGTAAVSKFIDAVASVAASLNAPLAATGPIPNRVQNQLLITSTATGSFGFELEEYVGEQMPLVEELTPVALALLQTQALLQGTLGTDDELADTAADSDPRALNSVRMFLDTLVGAEATCAIEYGEHSFRFNDVGQVRRSLERLSQDNLREEEQHLHGEFQGVLPKRRTFEFAISGQTDIIIGKVSSAIPDASILNDLLHQSVRIKVMTTRVGNGRPRYVLLEQPELFEEPLV